MLLCGGGSADSKILQDGDSGRQRSFYCGLSRGWGSTLQPQLRELVLVPSRECRAGCLGNTDTSPQRGQHHSQPAASTQADNFPVSRLASSLADAICRALCTACAWQMTGMRNAVTSSFLTHLHALGIEGRLRAWSCFGCFLLRVGFPERHRAGICGGAG